MKDNKERNGNINNSNNAKMVLLQMDARSGQWCSIEFWQGALLPVGGGGVGGWAVVLDVPGLQHAAGLGVVVNHHGLR